MEMIKIMREQESSFFDVETSFDMLSNHINSLKMYETQITDKIENINKINLNIAQIASEMVQYLNIYDNNSSMTNNSGWNNENKIANSNPSVDALNIPKNIIAKVKSNVQDTTSFVTDDEGTDDMCGDTIKTKTVGIASQCGSR